MKRTLHAVEVVTPAEAAERTLPDEVQLSLAEIAGAAKEGLLALAVGTGLAVLHEAMEHEVVRHEALLDRAGWETPPPGCRSSLGKLGAVRARNCG